MRTLIIIICIILIIVGLHYWNLRNQRKKYNGYTKKEIIQKLAEMYNDEWKNAKVQEIKESQELKDLMANKGLTEDEATLSLLRWYSENQNKEITVKFIPLALLELGLDAKKQPELLKLYDDVKRAIKF